MTNAPNESKNPAARLVILAIGFAFVAASLAAYFREPAGFTLSVYCLGGAGVGFLALGIFGSHGACDTTVHLLTLGAYGSGS